MRFAGLAKDVARALRPVGPLDAAIRYGPEAISLLAAGTAWAPPNATALERGGMMAEEAIAGLGLSALLSGGARHIARRHLLGKRQGMSSADYQNKLVQAQQFGDLANIPVQMLAPSLLRPYSQKVLEDAYARQPEGTPEPQSSPSAGGMTDEEMAMALLATGALGGSVLGPRDSFSTLRDPYDLRGLGGAV